jgi:hypothetical protein
MRIGGVVEALRRAGVEMTLSDAAALLSMCAWPAYPQGESGSTDVSAGAEELEVSVSRLRQWLCCLGSYRYIQVKIRVYMKALDPSLCLDLLKGTQTQEIRCRSGQVSQPKFVAGVEASGAPLSRAEALALSELLMRQKPNSHSSLTPKGNKKKGNKSVGGWSWLRDHDAGDDAECRRTNCNVEVDLLDRICNGDFFSAVL